MLLFLKNLLFTLVVPGTVAVYVPLSMAPPAMAGHAALRYGSLLPFGVGIAIYAWCVWDFASFGRGTPAPIDAPKHLVVRGLYQVVRNPMYVGVLSVILGWATCYASLAILGYGGGIWLMFHLVIVLYEEPNLRRSFGDEFEAYRARVHRWRPRRTPRSHENS